MRYKQTSLPALLLALWIGCSLMPSPSFAEGEREIFFEQTDEESQEEASLLRFLRTAIQPVGKTMYVWGGGWNEEDTAAGIEARSIGLSESWKNFADKQSASYNYKKTRYQIHDGLDCSGYVGWSLYNLLHSRNGEEGYVMKAKDMATSFSSKGWGKFIPSKSVKDFRAGDIMSNKTHVYIVIGSCKDGSVVVVHASPPGVQINGTVSSKGKKNSEAARLAKHYMKTYYPRWYAKYGTKVLDKSYLTSYSQMRWYLGEDVTLRDREDLSSKSAKEILKILFSED